MTYPTIKFEDIRKGDVLRWYRGGISHQATADQQLSLHTWDTADGYIIWDRFDSQKVVYVVKRGPVPDTIEPEGIGAVVVDAEGDTLVRVPPSEDEDRRVWFYADESRCLRWSILSQPIEIKSPGWVDSGK